MVLLCGEAREEPKDGASGNHIRVIDVWERGSRWLVLLVSHVHPRSSVYTALPGKRTKWWKFILMDGTILEFGWPSE